LTTVFDGTSGSRGLLPAPSPLRTVHESFLSHGSVLRKGLPYGDTRTLKCASCYFPIVRVAGACGAHHPERRHLLSPLSSDSPDYWAGWLCRSFWPPKERYGHNLQPKQTANSFNISYL